MTIQSAASASPTADDVDTTSDEADPGLAEQIGVALLSLILLCAVVAPMIVGEGWHQRQAGSNAGMTAVIGFAPTRDLVMPVRMPRN